MRAVPVWRVRRIDNPSDADPGTRGDRKSRRTSSWMFTLLSYVDSTRLAAILSLKNALQGIGKRMCLAGCHGLVQRILEVTNIRREFKCFEDVDSAASTWSATRVSMGIAQFSVGHSVGLAGGFELLCHSHLQALIGEAGSHSSVRACTSSIPPARFPPVGRRMRGRPVGRRRRPGPPQLLRVG